MHSAVVFILGYRANLSRLPANVFSVILVSILFNPSLWAQNLKRDLGATSVQTVTDVTGGQKYLLQDDDLALLQVGTDGSNSLTSSLTALNTADSKVTDKSTSLINSKIDTSGHFSNSKGVPAATGIGRMFNTKSDITATLIADAGPSWKFSLSEPVSHFDYSHLVISHFSPSGQAYTQVVMGDFNGDGLSEPLFFYASVEDNVIHWGMCILSASNPNVEEAPTQGPEFYNVAPQQQPVPITNSIVVGDFNGDGRDEIAALMTDGQTVAFYKVDPKTFEITKTQTLRLPEALTIGQATLAAGRFRDQPTADLVAVGLYAHGENGYRIVPIKITPTSDGDFTPEVITSQVYHFPNRHESNEVFAQAASMLYFPKNTLQQLVIGISTGETGGYVYIGSFELDGSFKFDWQSDTRISNDGLDIAQLQSVQVGNFDNHTSDGSYNLAPQIATYDTNLLFGAPEIRIFDVNVPSSAPPPGEAPKNWLKESSHYDVKGGLMSPLVATIVPGDLQGRSLRLGAPEVVRIPVQTQPDLVLGVPPMHVDWIRPTVNLDPQEFPNCQDPQTPCLLNLTVLPSMTAPGVGFATSFDFSSTSTSQAKRVSTTSWGISVKQTSEASVSFNDGLENASADVKQSAAYTHDHTVKSTYGTYTGQTDSLNATTGFADHVFYTMKAMNIYYYPVLGQVGCPKGEKECGDSDKIPAYVEYSVPDQVTHGDLDGTTLEWYQPVHEPGNVLSYPWNQAQLESQFTNKTVPLTDSPTCQGIDSSDVTYKTSWSGGSQTSKSAGSTNSFSDDLSISVSEGAGISGVDGATFKFGVDIAGSTSLSTLNETVASLSASDGIAITKPEFNGSIITCCTYDFASLIFGQKNSAHPSAQSVSVNSPDGKPVDISTTGPLFVGFLADVAPDAKGLSCGGGGRPWWSGVYNQPDVALNHPARWDWSKSTQKVSFNSPPKPSEVVNILSEPFYQMKGFFITKKDATGPSPNLATARAGEQLSLSARVYNYSLVDTTGPVFVSFYAQHSCSGALCDTPILIGTEKITSVIPGFKSQSSGESLPNWTMASVTFDTTNYPKMSLYFWVVVWMEDSAGNLAPEMQAHGLTRSPKGITYQSIRDVPVQPYSNNVGLYGANSPFYISDVGPSLGSTSSSGSLQKVTLSVSPQTTLDRQTPLAATLQAAGDSVESVNIAYFDGDPSKNGSLVDIQRIQHIEPGSSYAHQAFFRPQTCGVHQLYASAWINDRPEILASTSTNVTVQATDLVQSLMDATRAAVIGDSQLKSNLLALLTASMQAFQQGQMQFGQTALGSYEQQLSAASGKGITASTSNRLLGMTGTLLGCGSNGFSLAALPASATVATGSTASFTVSVTPSGGFNGTVAFSCDGAPQGASCSASTPSIALNGSTQSLVKFTVTTGSGATAAGVGGFPPASGSTPLNWFLAVLLSMLSIAFVPRERLRGAVLGAIVLLALLTGMSGCGNNGSAKSTPSGTYSLVVKGTSGTMAANANITLIITKP